NTIERVLQEIKDPEFRLVIALARHAGFRTPSEAKRLRWCDVNFSKKWMRVRSEKKDGDACAGHRPCPLFDPLLPYFEALPDETRAPNALVLPSLNGGGMKNLRTEFARAIERAGVPQWPRIFQNLRASALTDLAEEAPLADVCKWLGNSTPTAERHYFMVKGVELSEVKETG
ncbi:MAG: tyrosine-type recombinase/integrase, partial [Rhodopirellula sp. JB044]|uniref:tyrosine-type recombinase/integrase n=1 Tax=Rhodopirellula sp. JB044 TaxID=3342844 RepID=UPI00370C8DE4